jgi:cytochrome c
MRHLGLMIAVAACAGALAGCNKPSGGSQPQTSPTEQPSTPTPALSAEEMKKAQASLPAPYNTADLDNGQSKFALCQTCHTLVKDGPNMTGPNLYGVLGRKAASLPSFKYSDPLKASGWTWDAARIDTWITDPKATLPGTKMTFAGFKDPKDRTDVIAWLMLNTGYKP